eukprot:3831042-Rhodomonas_salina.1
MPMPQSGPRCYASDRCQRASVVTRATRPRGQRLVTQACKTVGVTTVAPAPHEPSLEKTSDSKSRLSTGRSESLAGTLSESLSLRRGCVPPHALSLSRGS